MPLQDEDTGAMKALRPIGAAEFILAPRQLPPIKDIEVRIDSSLRALGVEVRPGGSHVGILALRSSDSSADCFLWSAQILVR
jgi:hypothetical protein